MSEEPRRFTIHIIGLASGGAHECANQYIVSYDPEAHLPNGEYDGGALDVTCDRAKAGLFTPQEAMALWQSGPMCDCHRFRQDGERNRPLTAFSVEMEPRP